MIRIILADGHQLVREGIKSLLSTSSEFRVVAGVGDGIAAVKASEELKPDILMLDLGLPRMVGVDVIRQVRSTLKTQVVVVTAHTDEPHVSEALRAGASGYVLKDDSPDELANAIKAVAQGNHFISPRIRKSALTAALGTCGRSRDVYDDLTARERQILQHAAEGLSNTEIGQKLFISSRTVESHRANLMKKLSLTNQTDLVRFAIRRRLISP